MKSSNYVLEFNSSKNFEFNTPQICTFNRSGITDHATFQSEIGDVPAGCNLLTLFVSSPGPGPKSGYFPHPGPGWRFCVTVAPSSPARTRMVGEEERGT